MKRARTVEGAVRYLAANKPDVILVTDEGLSERKNQPFLAKVLSYIEEGGRVVIGLQFSPFVKLDNIDVFFETLGVSWRRGEYRGNECHFNKASKLPTGLNPDDLPGPYYMKALCVRNAQEHEKIYIPVEEPLDSQTAVAGAKMGKGYLAYVGDVNPTEETFAVILELCGLERLYMHM